MTWTPVDPDGYERLSGQKMDTWTPGALECYERNRDCQNCQASKTTEGRLRAEAYGPNRCQMPGIVQLLLDKGKPIPGIANPQKPGRARAHLKGIGLDEKRKRLADLRAKLCEFLGEGRPLNLSQMCARLNAISLNDYQNWHTENIRGSVNKMVEIGAIRAVKSYFPIVYELVDASKLDGLRSWHGCGGRNQVSITPSSSEFSQGRKMK